MPEARNPLPPQVFDPARASRDARLSLGHRVSFAGAEFPEHVRARLEETDILVMPCVVAEDGDRDSMSVVVKEALAMEVPVVATREVGLPELVHPGWGRLAPPRDPPALAAAIKDLLSPSPPTPARRWAARVAGGWRTTATCGRRPPNSRR